MSHKPFNSGAEQSSAYAQFYDIAVSFFTFLHQKQEITYEHHMCSF